MVNISSYSDLLNVLIHPLLTFIPSSLIDNKLHIEIDPLLPIIQWLGAFNPPFLPYKSTR